jgi:transaldolase
VRGDTVDYLIVGTGGKFREGLSLEMAGEGRRIGPNITCKIPTTEAGLEAMEKLFPLGVPLNATELFAVN